jgi:hypothetical protein
MRRIAFAVVALVGFCTPVQAETLPLIDGVPTTYTPGQPFTFTLHVPSLPDFSSYTLELVFSTTVIDPALLAFPIVAPVGSYVFPTNANFAFQFDAPPGAQEVRLTLSDSVPPLGVITVPGANDALATITVVPNAALTGPITLSVGSNTQFLYNMEANSYDPPGPIVIAQAEPPSGNPVPAPPGVALLGVGAMLLGLRARFARRAA